MQDQVEKIRMSEVSCGCNKQNQIVDYVRLKVNYVPSHWVKPGKE